MSQKHEAVDLKITALLTVDDDNEPQAVTVNGFGNIPRSAVRAIAEEALECHTGRVNHGYRVQLTPEVVEDDSMVFEVYKRFPFGTSKSLQ